MKLLEKNFNFYPHSMMAQSTPVNPEKVEYETLGVYKTLLCLTFTIVGVGYLAWRHSTLGSQWPLFSWALYIAEIYGFAGAILHIFMCRRLTIRTSPAVLEGAMVDVFIPTYNESEDLVKKTILAARNMDYPHRTWLLDDGNRSEMKALAKRLGVEYVARTDNVHAKAGNLNNALKLSRGEFIAIFDADHAPQKKFITSTLGYFRDEKVAFVQTPQDFFNLDSYQHRLKKQGKKLWTEQSLFFKIIQRGKDYWNAAFFCGSCAIVRRSALLKVGGFATETVTEDLHTSLRLHKAGFRSVYHAESLAYGIAPSSIAPFLKQRVRWGQGAMQVLRKENIFFTSKLTIAQRFNYLASIMTYFDGWQKGLFYIAPAFVLLTGILPISANVWVFLFWFLPYYLLSIWVFDELARGYGATLYIEQYNFARFAAFAWATLGLFRNNLKFEVTNKSLSRDGAMRRMFLPQILVLILNSVAIPAGLVMAFAYGSLPKDALVFNMIWATVNLTLGLAIFNFTRKTEHFIRSEYRFPIPLPMLLNESGINWPLTVDNVSSSGCRIYGRMPEGIQKGSMLSGVVTLPSGKLNVKTEVTSEIYANSGATKYLKAVGCRFHWDNPQDQDALDLFLYGSDLQWHLLELEEQTLTPVAWVRNRMQHGETGLTTEDRWATCDVSLADGRGGLSIAGLIPLPADGGEPKRVVVFSAINIDEEIAIDTHTRSGVKTSYAHTKNALKIDNSLSPVYILTIAPSKMTRQHDRPHPSSESSNQILARSTNVSNEMAL